MAHGLNTNFRAKEVMALGIEYNLGQKYLERLGAVGFATKNGFLWSISPAEGSGTMRILQGSFRQKWKGLLSGYETHFNGTCRRYA